MTDMQISLPLLIVRPSILNPVIKLLYTPMTGEMKCPIGYTFALRIPFHLLLYRCNRCINTINNDMIHFIIITWSYWFIDLDFTCFSPFSSSIGAKSYSSFTVMRSIAPKPPTCPSLLQPVHQGKSHLDFLYLSHMTPCYVSYAMSSFITHSYMG